MPDNQMKYILQSLILILIVPKFTFSQPEGKALDIFTLINEARMNPTTFLMKYKSKINEYEPKFISILEKSPPIEKLKWDTDLAKNCKESVYGNLNPEYKGSNRMCGTSSGNGTGYFSKDALYFVCDSYIHIMNENDLYFGFYIDKQGYAYMWGKTCTEKKYNYVFNQRIDSSKVDFRKINTAVNEKMINDFDKEMIKEINFVRQYPKVYAQIVANYLAEESKSWWGLGKDDYDAGLELIDELNKMKPVQVLYHKSCLYEAAKKHGEDCKQRGFIDHTGSDRSIPSSRIAKFCTGLNGGENLVGGPKNVRVLVLQLLIDAGISSRGHRYNMLNANWKYVACYGYEVGNMYNYIQNFASE